MGQTATISAFIEPDCRHIPLWQSRYEFPDASASHRVPPPRSHIPERQEHECPGRDPRMRQRQRQWSYPRIQTTRPPCGHHFTPEIQKIEV
tara:strand:+ start:64 stop:336 length:273 start_codon:yes stop_codon:yes gene_type:complete